MKFTKLESYSHKINENEISSFEEFTNVELSVYSDILNSLNEIYLLREENEDFPSVNLLEEEGISPYYRDPTWKLRGAINWFKFLDGEAYYYLGKSSHIDKVGNFLIEINNENVLNSYVYYSKDNIKIDEFIHDISHVKLHFRKIVPYTGAEERKKMNQGV